MCKIDQCPACLEITRLTKHHIYPKAHFGKGRHNTHIIYLCRLCHDELHRDYIPYTRKPKHKRWYLLQLRQFLQDKQPNSTPRV